ncbi:MAG: NAAT family transporter [Xanthomonadales bacterium]|nr:NAAT family transporter [Xanthomonadales bacterium]
MTVFMAFFAIMNPVANASLFIGLTQGDERRLRRTIALRSVLVAFAIVAVFAIGGRQIFSIFGITLPAFRIAGGLMIGAIGYHMLQGEASSMHQPSKEDAVQSNKAALDIAIAPLGIPVLAGPGTIATAMNFAAESTLLEITRVLSAFALMCIITFGAFMAGQSLTRLLGQNGIKVISRLMGLILAVIGVQMVIEGIRGAVAG